jgi:hypothetical protein
MVAGRKGGRGQQEVRKKAEGSRDDRTPCVSYIETFFK